MAADRVRLEYIEQFARARPDQLDLRVGQKHAYRARHKRHGIDAGIGDTAGKDADIGGSAARQRFRHSADLVAG